jgi:beta-lactamase regulating signal transducer with metallopeptidase domain/protocatechuate 3,4-dioxygenase beta subunit
MMTVLRLDPGDHLPRLAGLLLLQTTAVVLLARLVSARRGAATRHGIWLCALACVLLGPSTVAAVDRSGLVLARVPLPCGRAFAADRPAPRADRAAAADPVPGDRPAPIAAVTAPAPSAPDLPVRPAIDARRPAIDARRGATALALFAWACGSLALLARLAFGCRALVALRRGARPIDDPGLDGLRAEVGAALGLEAGRVPAILESGRVDGPIAAGALRPVVILPAGLAAVLDRPALRDVLIHECAHVARRDPLVGLLQRLAAALYWPQPLIHLLNRELARAREEVCDNAVIRAGDRRRYARTLVDLAESLGNAPRAAVALGLLPARWSLADRVAGLLDERRATTMRVNTWALAGLATLFLAVGVAVAGLRPAAARPPAADGPAVAKAGAAPQGELAEDEIMGTVVDERGRPIEGVLVDVWDWYPGNAARTDARGRFRLSVWLRDAKGRKLPGGFDRNDKLEVRFLKEGYSPVLILDRKPGTGDWDVTLDARTYFEGKVTAPDGGPVAGALIRADQGPRSANPGYIIDQIWTETRSGPDGRYRLYVAPDDYKIEVRAPGVGVARLKATAGKGGAHALDIGLAPGVTVRARTVDSLTGEPVAGVRLHHWQYKGIEGTSDAEGNVTIDSMFHGKFAFEVEPPEGHARWWSEQAASVWARRYVDENRSGWQRNFGAIDFELKPGMAPVTIELERGVTIRGAVLDPDGKPVAGATVAPALSGTGNSITGDTRYSVETGQDGRFTMLLPASNAREYNLIAHDGAFLVWRRWANGVLDPIRTRPGQVLDGVTLRLERPATVRGRVRDASGRPVARREVRACGADQLDNRYYVPTVETDAEGRFELKFVRPGENFVQAAPFWLDPRGAPGGTSETVTVEAGQVKEGVELVGRDQP